MFALVAVAAATLNLTYVDVGKTFTLPKQTTIVVTLASCGPCGYSWRLEPLERTVLRRVSHHYVAPKTKRIGGAGKEIWRFSTIGAGRSPLQLVYLPPGRNVKPDRHFGVTINVS